MALEDVLVAGTDEEMVLLLVPVALEDVLVAGTDEDVVLVLVLVALEDVLVTEEVVLVVVGGIVELEDGS